MTSSSGLGKARQTLIDFKAWSNGGREKAAAVAEVHRDEMALIHRYEAAVSEAVHLSEKVRNVLQQQLKIIREQDASICAL